MANKSNFKQLQMAMFSRSAKMMSYELRTRREEWDILYLNHTSRARRRHRRHFRRTSTYCMHTCYQLLLVELQTYLNA